METNNQKELARQMDKQGMRVFIAGTAAVYGLSLVYCFLSGHLFEAGLVGAVMVGLGILISWLYKSE
jgi:hypothetical protein